jgi:hypothetical protein
LRILGAILLGLGVLGFFFGGLPYKRTKSSAQIGSLELEVKEEKKLPMPSVVSALFSVAGLALLWTGRKPAA